MAPRRDTTRRGRGRCSLGSLSPSRRSPKGSVIGAKASTPTKRRGTPPKGARVRPGGVAWFFPATARWMALSRLWLAYRLRRQLFRAPPHHAGVLHAGGAAWSNRSDSSRAIGKIKRMMQDNWLVPGRAYGPVADRGNAVLHGRRSKRAAELSKRAYKEPEPEEEGLDLPQSPRIIGEGQYDPEAVSLNERLVKTYERMVDSYKQIDQEIQIKRNLQKNGEAKDWKIVQAMVKEKNNTIQILLQWYDAEEAVAEDHIQRLLQNHAVPVSRPKRLKHHPSQLDD